MPKHQGIREAIEIQRDYIRHVHIEDVNEENTPCLLGKEIVDLRRIMSMLEGIGHDGYLATKMRNARYLNCPNPRLA
jgi:sugar phosphate isomerase/epimerase